MSRNEQQTRFELIDPMLLDHRGWSRENISAPLPPWSEQVRAAEVFLAVAAIRKQALARLATLDRLPSALLRQVFGTGGGGC